MIPAPSVDAPAPPIAAAEPLLAFSWGYEGWGNHASDLVHMVDAVEAARGFGPPLFVDVRLRRQVRAVGFREHAFERLLGPERHVWLKGLGNVAIEDPSLPMGLADRRAVETLLDLVQQRAAAGARVIFFCSCGSPLGRATCHRGLVAQALVVAARRRHAPLAVHEWPGGAPVVTDVDVADAHLRRLEALRRARDGTHMRLPVPPAIPFARAAALPSLSILRCHCGSAEGLAVSGAAIMTSRGWMFPVHTVGVDAELEPLQLWLDGELARLQLTPLGTPPSLPPRWRHDPLVPPR